MENQSNYVSAGRIFTASALLFCGLLDFLSAAGYVGPENDYVADNWGPVVIILLIVMFDLGWWFEKYYEHLAMSKERTVVVIATIGFFTVMPLIGFGSLTFIPRGFWQYSIASSMYLLGSGFLYRTSASQLQLLTKIRSVPTK